MSGTGRTMRAGALATIVALVAVVLALAVPVSPAGEPADVSAAGAGERNVKRPKTRTDLISFGRDRKRQMAGYSGRHYGKRTWRLRNKRAIVLHYTASSTYSSVWHTFQSNAPALGERPGVCTHFVVDKDGKIYQLVRAKIRCRHAIGLNHLSIGIEMVQEDLGDPHRTAKAILRRKKQARSAVRLTAWLKQRNGIKIGNVIGHGMANRSKLFKEKTGWRNDHVDWQRRDVKKFRKRIHRVLYPGSR